MSSRLRRTAAILAVACAGTFLAAPEVWAFHGGGSARLAWWGPRPGFGFWGPYWGAGYWGAYGYGSPYARATGGLRLLVQPKDTRVFVDGYYAGIVDDFDGRFQSLDLPAGGHRITLKLEGHKTHRLRLYVPPGHTTKVHWQMTEGTGDDEQEDR